MLRSGIIELCKKQFALDYNCAPRDFDNKTTLITAPRTCPGQRRYATGTSALSILSFNGKLVICADERRADWCRDVLAHRMSAEWGFNPGTLRAIDKKLSEFGWQIARVCLKNSLIRNFGRRCAISASSILDLALLSLRVYSLN